VSASAAQARHTKIPGFVQSISADRKRWWARLDADGEDLFAEMSVPLPDDAVEGSLFTIHRTKAGHTYVYWIKTRWTKRQVKVARQRGRQKAREWAEAFGWDQEGAPTSSSGT